MLRRRAIVARQQRTILARSWRRGTDPAAPEERGGGGRLASDGCGKAAPALVRRQLMIKTIPLNKLVASPANVRRGSDSKADAELKADIVARGLLQNLVVTSLKKPRGCFAVEAGERRRRALQSLAEEGSLAKDHAVCCLIVDRAAAQETSLAENFQRLSMNPADECLAFQQLIAQGADVEGVARRFGLTVRFVEGRLRLATLAPVVFEALGAGEISLEVAKAYAATADQERQAYVFEQMGRGYGAAHPDSIRRMMTQATVGGGDRRALFVGEEAYLAAGGRIERDLFSDEADARWLDIALLERLAGEKLEALAADTAAETGLGFVRPHLDAWISCADTEGLSRLSLETPRLTDPENAEVDRLEQEIEEIAAGLEDEECSEEAHEAAEARLRELGTRIEAIVDKPPLLDEELRPRAGAFLLIDQAGRPRLDHGRYVEAAPQGEESEPDEDADAGAKVAKAGGSKPAGLSQRMVD
jgi:ParB family chromosome partitioning protein